MRLLRRNTVSFTYRKRTGQEETLDDGLHIGNWNPVYGEAVTYRGNISIPSGFATDNLFGIGTRYTHILMMDNPNADIAEDGEISWNGNSYIVKAVRRSINVLTAAIEQCTADHADPDPAPTPTPEPEPEPEPTPGGDEGGEDGEEP